MKNLLFSLIVLSVAALFAVGMTTTTITTAAYADKFDNPAHMIDGPPGSFIKDKENEKGGGCNGSGFSDEFGNQSPDAFFNSNGACDNTD